MKKSFVSYLVSTSLVFLSMTAWAQKQGAANKAGAKTTAGAAAPKDAKDANEKSALDRTLENVLSQIPFAKMDFNIDFEGGKKVNKKTNQTTTTFNINFLELDAIVKFANGKIIHKFVEDEKQNAQLKNVVPYIEFNTSDVRVIAKARVDKKGLLTIRFCQNYVPQTDYCEERRVDIKVRSGNFNEILRISLKDITLNFTSQILGGKFEFNGTCTAFKSVIDENAVLTQKPVDCAFSGNSTQSDEGSEFNYKFRFKSKTQ